MREPAQHQAGVTYRSADLCAARGPMARRWPISRVRVVGGDAVERRRLTDFRCSSSAAEPQSRSDPDMQLADTRMTASLG